MKKRRRFNIKRLDKSFKYAFDGLKFAIKTEPNLKFHLIIGFIVMLGGVFFKISTIEWIFLVSIIGLVIGAELLNTAIEHLVDLATKEYKRKAMLAKDTAAAYVMILSLTSVVVGLFIFLPKVIELIKELIKWKKI